MFDKVTVARYEKLIFRNPIHGPYVAVPRTELLLEEVFLYRGGLPRSGRWPDSSVSVNHFYARAYWGLAQAAAVVDDAPAIPRFVEAAEAWEALGRHPGS